METVQAKYGPMEAKIQKVCAQHGWEYSWMEDEKLHMEQMVADNSDGTKVSPSPSLGSEGIRVIVVQNIIVASTQMGNVSTMFLVKCYEACAVCSGQNFCV